MSYRRRNVKNKIHKIRPKKSIFKSPIFWSVFLFLILFTGIVYLTLFLENIQVKNTTISGNQKISEQDIKDIVLKEVNKKFINFMDFDITSKSIFLVNADNIKKQILDKFPIIEDVKVYKNFPQNIAVQIKERSPFAIFCSQGNENCFYIDKAGIIFEKLPNFTEDMPAVRKLSDGSDIFVGKEIVEKSIMDTVLKIKKNLNEKFQIDIKEAFISSPLRLDIKTAENWQIYFNLSDNFGIDLQITKLNLLLSEEISQEKRNNLQYIDLRFDRAYYK